MTGERSNRYAIVFLATALVRVGGYIAYQYHSVDRRPCAPGGC